MRSRFYKDFLNLDPIGDDFEEKSEPGLDGSSKKNSNLTNINWNKDEKRRLPWVGIANIERRIKSYTLGVGSKESKIQKMKT